MLMIFSYFKKQSKLMSFERMIEVAQITKCSSDGILFHVIVFYARDAFW